MINENYKKRLQQLAGLIKENASIGPDGTLTNFTHIGTFIPGDKLFKYSVTYQEVDPNEFGEDEEINDYTDRGFQVEPTVAPLSEIIKQGVSNYYVKDPSSTHISGGVWWSSHSDTDFRTGVDRTYSLHIAHEDGSKLSDEEAQFINQLLQNGSEWEEPYEQDPGTWR